MNNNERTDARPWGELNYWERKARREAVAARDAEPSTYQEDTMERIHTMERVQDYLAVDTESGTIMSAVNIRLVRRDHFPEGDEELSDSEVSSLAMERGIYLDDYSVNC